MLSLLLIRNFALIENLELEPAAGFTVITGETGAGKSIVLAALNLLLGGKAAADLIRQGEEQAQVEAVFDVPASMAEEYDELILRRVVSREGRNRVQINGSLNTLSNLAQISTGLVSLCGQHEQQSLLKPEQHLFLLDAFAGLSPARLKVAELVGKVYALEREIKVLEHNLSRQEERELWLKQQIKELSEAGLRPGEEQELLEEQQLLANVTQRAELSSDAHYALYGVEKASALTSINKALLKVRQLAALDAKLEPLARILEDGYYNLEDAARQLRDYNSKIACEPGRLDWVEERLSLLQRLSRRYGGTLQDALDALPRAKEELDNLRGGQDDLNKLERKREQALAEALEQARQLSLARKEAAPHFSRQAAAELSGLGMNACLFETRFSEPAGLATKQGKLNRHGLETVEFYLAPNPGEGFRPLARIASGGELSRLLLALRSLTARQLASPTLIFDEVDAGIGGDIGLAVGGKLAGLAKDAQVICITHLPQIAAFAECHLRVSKQVSQGRTSTRLERLNDDERLEELARMLGDVPSALSHARSLLALGAQK